jgi:hypothetical protein
VTLPTVPANGATTATLTWRFDPATDLDQGRLANPSVQAWVKGSVRPAISDVDEPGEGE